MRAPSFVSTSRGTLYRRFGSAHAFTVEPGAVKAANTSFAGGEHRASIPDPAGARLFLLGGSDPVDPISPSKRRNVRPHGPCLQGRGSERLFEICRYFRFRLRGRRSDLERDHITRRGTGSFTQFSIHFKPMALLSVGFEHGLERNTIEGAFNCRHAPRGQLRTRAAGQDQKSPGTACHVLCWP